jgi:hypothetical protein
MSLVGVVVEDLLNLIGLEIPWRRLVPLCLLLLAAIGYFDPGGFDSGITAWVRSQQCTYEGSLIAATGGPTLPKMVVVHTPSGCIVRRYSPPRDKPAFAHSN